MSWFDPLSAASVTPSVLTSVAPLTTPVAVPLAAAFIQGLSLCASLIVAIGAQNLFVLRQGLQRRHVGPVVAFCAACDALLFIVGTAGMAQAVARMPGLGRALGWAGAAFLLLYGARAMRRALWPRPGEVVAQGGADQGADVAVDGVTVDTAMKAGAHPGPGPSVAGHGAGAAVARMPDAGPALAAVLAQCAAFTLLNPHVWLDCVLLVGGAGARLPPLAQPWFVAGGALASLLWFTLLGFGARWLAPWFRHPQAWRWLDGAIALLMWQLAWSLARG